MSATEGLDAAGLRAVIETYRDLLGAHRERVNRLNVYPVPDGDTGTNMALTLDSVVVEIEALGEGPDLPAVCKAVAHGSLMGARGNSGVILSQLLRGLSGVLSQYPVVDGPALAAALTAASVASYEAVGRPVEGTILTVGRAAAEGASLAADSGATLVEVLDAARDAADVALAHTPEQLPVLAEAGVVDAGGAGLLLFFDAALHVVDHRARPEPGPMVEAVGLYAGGQGPSAGGDGLADLRYEVMYLLEAPDSTIPEFKNVWAGVGDSIVVVGGDGLFNCHIHTDDVGAAIEAALDCGRPRNIRVTDLLDQVEEERWVRDAAAAGEQDDLPVEPEVTTAVVAVATGEGIRRIFRSLGVHHVVTGGQTMNPSTQQLLAAVEAARATEVVILPNNKNIVAVAEQVDELTAKAVRVVPTRSVAEGFAALLAYDPLADGADNAAGMADAAAAVLAGEVTQAVRDSGSEVGPIRAGDWLGLCRDGIRSVAPDVAEATIGLLADLVTDRHEVLTVIEGEGSTPAATRAVTEWVAEHHGDVTVEVHHGGQPLYPYLLGLE